MIYMGDNDRLFVVNRRGRLLPGFRSRMKAHDHSEDLARHGR